MDDDIRHELARLTRAVEELRAALLSPPPMIDDAEAARRLRISPRMLRDLVAQAPPDSPGAPVELAGRGQRTHRRWNPDTLEEWARHATAARELPPHAPRSSTSPKPTRRRRGKAQFSTSDPRELARQVAALPR